MPQSDGSWRGTDSNGVIHCIPANRVSYFKSSTHEASVIVCAMLDKVDHILDGNGKAYRYELSAKDYGRLPTLSEYASVRLKIDCMDNLTLKPDSFAALNGDLLRDGSWCFCDHCSNTLHTLSGVLAKQFMDITHAHATVMCYMLDTEKESQNILRFNNEIVVLRDEESMDQPASRKDLYEHTSSSGPPYLRPSAACVPRTISRSNDTFADLLKCIKNADHIQSFWSDLSITYAGQTGESSSVIIRDETLHVPPFDESLYCQIVIENHRFSMAELADQEQKEADMRASRAFMWGSLYGLFTLNPLVPFFFSNQARVNAPRHMKIEELIPDPKLLFMQDHYSLLSMVQAGTPLPRMRRLILHPIISGDQVYVRVLPAVLTHDSVMPCQVFSFGKNYFMRPICAGMSPEQPNYHARQIHRQYYHLRLDGGFVDTGTRIEVKGVDIDTHRYKLFKFTCDTRELEYYYIDYATEPGHVF
jgi:hypothetical protein